MKTETKTTFIFESNIEDLTFSFEVISDTKQNASEKLNRCLKEFIKELNQ